MLSLETRKSISCLAWNPDSPDEVAVSFHFCAQIHVYDLSTVDSARPSPVRLLQVAGIKKDSGNRTMIFAPVPLRSNFIFAGSEEGCLRGWSVSKSAGSKSFCNFLADPARSSSSAVPIIGLFVWDATFLTVVLKDGVVCIYDLVDWRTPAFSSSSSEPTLKWKFHPNRQISSVESVHHVSNGLAVFSEVSAVVWVVDCVQRTALRSFRPFSMTCRPLETPQPTPELETFTLEQLREIGRSRSTNSEHQFAFRTTLWKQSLCPPILVCLQSQQFSMHEICKPWSNPCVHPSSSGSFLSQAVHVGLPAMGNISCTTLRGRVVDASQGGLEIRLELATCKFLLSFAGGNTFIMRCEWFEDNGSLKSAELHLAGLQNDLVHLKDSYDGPSVTGGRPAVFLRVASIPTTQIPRIDLSLPCQKQTAVSQDVLHTTLTFASSIPYGLTSDAHGKLFAVSFGCRSDINDADSANVVEPTSKRQRLVA